MKLSGLLKKLRPLQQKLIGRLPLCPWPPIWERLDPRALSAHPPPANMRLIAEDGAFKQIRFNDTHEVWLPKETALSVGLWNEYLSVFWPHRVNAHYYLKHGTLVKPGDVCMDCGACEGFFGLQALAAGVMKVVCIEPNEIMAACLRKTFTAEIATGRVIVVNAAAGAMEGTAKFSFDVHDPFSGKVETSATAINVSVATLSQLFTDLKLPRVDFIKMDIEGAEIQALEGALPLLKKFHPKLAITTYHRPFDYAILHALATASGYRQISCAGLVQRDDRIYRPAMLHAF